MLFTKLEIWWGLHVQRGRVPTGLFLENLSVQEHLPLGTRMPNMYVFPLFLENKLLRNLEMVPHCRKYKMML